jgi:DNA-binding MarR family transcriptional regulator
MRSERQRAPGVVVPFPVAAPARPNRPSQPEPKGTTIGALAFRAMLWLRERDLDPARRIGSQASSEAQRSLGEVLSFMQLLWAVTHGLESTSKRMLSTVGVTGPQRLVLRLIGQYDELSPGEVAEILHVHPSSLTGMLRRLEHGGLIRRRRHSEDGRRAVLTLTSRGRTLSDSQTGTVESKVRSTLRKVSPAKAAAARDVLKALAKQLGVDSSGSLRAAAPSKTRARARAR